MTDACGTACRFARAVVEGACRTVQVVCECACGKACGLSRVQRMTGPDPPWCRETPCGAWLCGLAEEAGLRMGWFMAVAKMAVIRALKESHDRMPCWPRVLCADWKRVSSQFYQKLTSSSPGHQKVSVHKLRVSAQQERWTMSQEDNF